MRSPTPSSSSPPIRRPTSPARCCPSTAASRRPEPQISNSKEGNPIMADVTGKTALVTGASRGIGRASALALAKGGARVVVHYSSGAAEAEAVVAEIRKAGGRADMVGADLAAPDGAHALARRVRDIAGGRLDILVANAGVSQSATIEDTTVAE